jgi:NAD dependent epimerase/dehydratase
VSGLTGARVLVTGADGFIGSHLSERLVAEGAEVRALCVYNSNGSRGWLDGLDPDRGASLDVRLGDIRDGGFVHDLVDQIDVVFHLAALIAIPFSYQAPASFVETNVNGTLNVLEAVKRAGNTRLIHTSTSEVYGTPDVLPITEDHPLHGQSPYSATKIGADMLCESYARSFETPVSILRPFNTYGPRQSTRAVIPTILSQLLADRPSVALGSLEPRRDFTFVADTVEGFVRMALAETSPGTTVHLGTGTTVSIGDLFDLCCKITGRSPDLDLDSQRVRPEASEVDVLVSDPARARALIGWSPSVSLEDGLGQVAEWVEANPELFDVETYHR